MTAIARALLTLGLTAASVGGAAAYVEISGVFVADAECQAFASFKRQTNPGGVVTVPGQTYTARGLSREQGGLIHLEVPGARPGQRWVDIGCGELRRRDRTPAELLPFFDDRDRPDDPAPSAPLLSDFDRAALALCGNWGSRPSRDGFRALLDDPAHAETVEGIQAALGGTVLGAPGAFKDELARVWFQEAGFAHIFCGEPSSGNLGGLHFAGRYLQMQERGWGGLAPVCAKTEIAPPVYTLGVRYLTPQGSFRDACPKGYPLSLDAGEILIEATRALKLMLPRTSGKSMCLHQVAEAGERSYLAVFVIENRAVRTFYPDASPSCDGNRPPEACLCEP